MDDLISIRPVPALPGVGTGLGPVVTAVLIEAQLEAPAIHTHRHFAGELTTHDFFSREALHAALCDFWQPIAPETYVPDPIPYGSTPLVALNPQYVVRHYASPGGWDLTAPTDPHLTIGTMQALSPGTRLRAVLWGDPSTFPPHLFEGRSFRIGKRRATARIVRCVRQDVRIDTRSATPVVQPIQIPRDIKNDPRFGRAIAYRRRAHVRDYLVVDMALSHRVPRFVIDGVTVPALDYWDALNSYTDIHPVG